MPKETLRTIGGRYELGQVIASGGMAVVHFGRVRGAAGFSRAVAIKKMHAHLASSQEFVDCFIDEARLAARIRHPNVVPTLDVLSEDKCLYLVLEYVHGIPLSQLVRLLDSCGGEMPIASAARIVADSLFGLHAAHEARDELGRRLGVVHRDVSPQNILVGADGLSRVLDFGVAKAEGRMQSTAPGIVKGKIGYMAREQLLCEDVSPRSDVYAAGVVLWECLTGKRFVKGGNDPMGIAHAILKAGPPPAPSTLRQGIPPELDAVVQKATRTDSSERFASALLFAEALEPFARSATHSAMANWLSDVAGPQLSASLQKLNDVESGPLESVTIPEARPVEGSLSTTSIIANLDPSDAKPTPNTDAVPESETSGRGRTFRSSVRNVEPPPPKRPFSLSAAALIALNLCLVGLAAWSFMRGPASPQTALGPQAAPAVSSQVETQSVGVLAPVEPRVAEVSPSASASAPMPKKPVQPRVVSSLAGWPETSVAPPVTPKPAVAPPSTKPAMTGTASRPSCASPYWVDSRGIRRVRPECLD